MSVTIVLLAALGGAALQDQAAPRVETRSEIHVVSTGGDGPGRLDANGDGEVTREEFSAPMGNAFDRMDTDQDGRLSTAELAARPGPGAGGPGFHTFTTTREGPGRHEVRIVTGDGVAGGHGGSGLPGMMVFGGPDGPGGDAQVFTFRRSGPEGGPPVPGGSGQQIFVRRFGGPDGHGDMDKDGDGKVSQEEFLAPMREVFGRMDADHDGFLDGDEDRPAPPPAP